MAVLTQDAADRAPARSSPLDLSRLVIVAFAAILCLLIVLPLSWLFVYSFADRSGHFTLGNFRQLVSDPSFLDPLATTFILSTAVSFICCAVAAPIGWLVARTDMPARGFVRVLVTASFVTP